VILISRATLLVLLALGASGASACREGPKRVVYDLAARAAVADHQGAAGVVLFGTPGAEGRLVAGFSGAATGASQEPSLRSDGEPELLVDWATPEARVAVLDAAPATSGLSGLAAEVWLNDAMVERFRLNDARHRYRIPLPADAQRVGENRLRFSFGPGAMRRASELEPVDTTIVFYSLAVGPASDPGIEDLLSRDAPHPFGVDREGGVPRLHMIGPARLRFVLRLPEGAELRFTPELSPGALAAAGSASFRVGVQGEGGPEEEAWAAVLDQRTPALPEQVVPMPGGAGEIVRLTLAIEDGSDRFAWASWAAPRLMGRSHPDPLEPGPVAPTDDDRATALRHSLEGANVVLVVLDAARARQLGTYGYPRRTTPEIDRIAAEGVVFEHAYTPASYTLAAMSSLWTSQHPDRHHRDLSFSARLPHDKLTLAEVLSGAGVFTIGFTANAMTSAAFGLDRGFEEFHEVFRTRGERASAFREVVPPRLSELSGRRFFAYVHYREPHFPYDPEPPFDTLFGPEGPIPPEGRRDWTYFREVNQGRRPFGVDAQEHLVRLYDGNLAFVDREVGALRRALEDEELWDRTVFIVTADHGEELFEHGFVGHNVNVYEPSVHIPLIMRFPPGSAPGGARVSGWVDLRDLAPTIADVFGVRGLGGSDREFQGRSLLPVVAGAPGRPAVLSRTVWDRPRYGLREGRFTYLLDTRTGEERLYDRDADPGETRDIGEERPLRMAFYRQALRHWMRQPGPAGPTPGEAAALSAEQCQNLRLLGYVQGGQCQ